MMTMRMMMMMLLLVVVVVVFVVMLMMFVLLPFFTLTGFINGLAFQNYLCQWRPPTPARATAPGHQEEAHFELGNLQMFADPSTRY